MGAMPEPVGVIAPLLLAGVLLVSALAKWREPLSTRSAITLLRLPGFLRQGWVARALPIGEAVLVALMLAPWLPVARLGSWGAAALFVLYLVIIARAMTFSPRPSCGCFGRIGDQRVRARTVWRNALFVVLAAVFVWFTAAGHTVPATLVAMDATGWAWLAAAIVTGAVVVLVGAGSPRPSTEPSWSPAPGDHTSSVPAAEGPEDPQEYIRAPIPDAMLVDPEGTPHLLHQMAGMRAQLLVFVNCFCGPTHTVTGLVPTFRARMPQLDVRLVFSGVEPMASTEAAPTDDAWQDLASVTWRALGLQRSPAAVLLGADGLLAGGPVDGLDEVEEFVAEIAEALAQGSPAEDGAHAEEVVPVTPGR